MTTTPVNWIICPVRNNLHLTRKAVKTFLAQDIGDVMVLVVNNDSTDGTDAWLNTQANVVDLYYRPPLSVAKSWNTALKMVFSMGNEFALVVNNDVELRPDTYRRLLEDGGGFVTAVGTRDPEKIRPQHWIKVPQVIHVNESNPSPFIATEPLYALPDPAAKRPHPDFSCYLIRKQVYEKVGPFDEKFLIAFGEDWDYHVRLHKAGIEAYCIDLPFLHHGSATIKNADPVEIHAIQQQAEKNRAYFKKKWGMDGASEAYYRLFGSTAPKAEGETGTPEVGETGAAASS